MSSGRARGSATTTRQNDTTIGHSATRGLQSVRQMSKCAATGVSREKGEAGFSQSDAIARKWSTLCSENGQAETMTDLKLIALDEEDLDVISAHVQDAVLKVGDMGLASRDRRFALMLNRFDWTTTKRRGKGERKRAALRFDNVIAARSSGFDPKASEGVLELLAVRFAPTDAPAGTVTLDFAGGGTVALDVECLEARLHDLGAAWAAKATPAHDLSE